jgi:hypothetical protein
MIFIPAPLSQHRVHDLLLVLIGELEYAFAYLMLRKISVEAGGSGFVVKKL